VGLSPEPRRHGCFTELKTNISTLSVHTDIALDVLLLKEQGLTSKELIWESNQAHADSWDNRIDDDVAWYRLLKGDMYSLGVCLAFMKKKCDVVFERPEVWLLACWI
jgi:hypothetical protein